MPLQPLPIGEEISIVTDWFEIAAFSSRSGRVPLNEIRSQFQLQQEEEPSDWSDEDEAIEDLQTRLCSKASDRQRILGEHYPFRVSDDGGYFEFRDSPTIGGTIYIFCLLISQANGSEILSDNVLSNLSNRDRDLFQVCATLCAAGFCAGPAISFGWPRPDRSGLIPKLQEIERALGARARRTTLPGVGTHVKDDEVDVIAWREEPDKRVPSMYVLGQAASGRNWKTKSIRGAIDHVFHQTWFEVPPPMSPLAAMFIPFAPDETDDAPMGFGETESAEAWRMNLELGCIHDRYRVPRYAAMAPGLKEAGVVPIERLGDLPALSNWVEACRTRFIVEMQP